MVGRYQVRSYNWSNLVALFVSGANGIHQSLIQAKPQIQFLNRYCQEAGVQTLLLEAPYIDRHYSEDYIGYYVRCHHEYPKLCSRLHFFRKPLSRATLGRFMNGTRRTLDFRELDYRGFVVIKPLPQTIVGRTCLRPLPQVNGNVEGGEHFLTRDGYTPNLFGIDVPVAALPFQEQDHEVGMCATSAMWTALHGTASVFDTPILSPLQITKRAFSRRPMPGVSLPSDGLDIDQLAAVFHDVGLEANQISAAEKYMLQAVASAYLRAQVPVILTVDFNLRRYSKDKNESDTDEIDYPELHGVTLSGMGRMDGVARPLPDTGLILRSSRLRTLYAHDDGVGPYSEIRLDTDNEFIVSSWIDDETGKCCEVHPEALLIPVHHKMRVSFIDVFEAVHHLDWYIEQHRLHAGSPFGGRPEWDIFLTSASDFKRSTLNSPHISARVRKRLLAESFPHFFWRVVAYVGERPVLEYLLDASDLRQGHQLMYAILYDKGSRESIKRMFDEVIDAAPPAPPLTLTMLNDLSSYAMDGGPSSNRCL